MGSPVFPNKATHEGVRRIGMPRALLFYRYGSLWTAFFESLGCEVVLSEPTDKGTVARGDALSNDECCLASKAYLGHVAALLESGACDAVFVPSIANVGLHRGFCTKFQALPDLVANTFADKHVRVLSCLVNEREEKTGMKEALIGVASQLGIGPREAKRAWKAAAHAQTQAERFAVARQMRALTTLERAREAAHIGRSTTSTSHNAEGEAGAARANGPTAMIGGGGAGPRMAAAANARAAFNKGRVRASKEPLGILLAAHPYVAHDPYLGGALVDLLERMGATVLFTDETDRKRALQASFGFSNTLPWIVNRELVGSLMLLHERVDGIVLVSAFPCGPDSMTDDAIVRCIQGKPILNLTIDAQSGTAGLETRVESFVDILRYQRKGGYVHAADD
ncbi:hypothetical protein B5F40_00820 [Gordonibacter sp. An230]|uniref:acyl-CoA dehydratase activase-related protein n=1 Tax=Gordonibacter sp. An230 TaxID=1965592 RepID=UPI000B394218|nr:acyl-CoA dehydratase activase-related protein [Gordonibacter sp. An230]OUO92473.1 hypothetical protein B5F40_00820 [Gordonibacter sp. An230]